MTGVVERLGRLWGVVAEATRGVTGSAGARMRGSAGAGDGADEPPSGIGTAGRERVAGRPASPTGASSLHLWWEVPALTAPAEASAFGKVAPSVESSASVEASALVEVSVVLEIVTPPSVRSLYFWALQVGFADGERTVGVAHTGLQWNRRYPGGTAVNWGGYATVARAGEVLRGSRSSLPGFADDANTLGYPWAAGRRYRLRVYRAQADDGRARQGVWRAEVIDVESGAATVIRDLYGGGDRLVAPVVWSEVFADCDAPSVRVRWSDFVAVGASGPVIRPSTVRVGYQSVADGGCSNTSAAVDAVGILQVTNVPRGVPHGTPLALPLTSATA